MAGNVGIDAPDVQKPIRITKIHSVDFRSVDLNLLVIFDALYRHRSVNKAADSVGLSQPATSAALARLRTLFEDPLFVRGRGQMEPTPRADEMATAVHQVVRIVKTDIFRRSSFEPAAAERGFTLLMPDIGEVAFLPEVFRRVRKEAPGVKLHTVARPRKAAADALESGEADLAVGFFPDLQKTGYFQQALFTNSYACIACARHAKSTARMTLRQYLSATHVVVRPDGREHLLDRYLEEQGWARNVALEVSHFMSLQALLPGSDLVATVPTEIAAVLGRYVKLTRIELPFRAPDIQVQQYWHRRVHNDAANRWLRRLFYEVSRREPGTSGK